VPAPLTATVGVSKAISGIQVNDDALGGETFTAQVTDTLGNLSAIGSGIVGSGSHNLSITGTLSQVNAALATLRYSSAVAGSENISVKAIDSDGSAFIAGLGVIIYPADDSVGLQVSGPITATVGVSKAIIGVQVNDDALGGETFTVQVSDTTGNLSANGTGVSGSGSSSLSITGTLSQVNAALSTLNYNSAVAASESVLVKVTDSDGSMVTNNFTVTTTPAPIRFVGTGDFDGNGKSDIVWASNGGGQATVWLDSNGTLQQFSVPGVLGTDWTLSGVGDFNGDGNSDLVWTSQSGQAAVSELNGANLIGFGFPPGRMGSEWQVVGIGDFNGDHKSDLLWVDRENGQTAVWTMNGTTLAGFGVSNGAMGSEWKVIATGDFNNDGRDDVLWESNTGTVDIWDMNGATLSGFVPNVGAMGSDWRVAGTGHFNGDTTSDIVWVDSANHVQIWQMSNGRIGHIFALAGLDGLDWHLKGVGKFANDGNSDLLWISDSGAVHTWVVNGTGVTEIPLTAPTGNIVQLTGSSAESPHPADNSPGAMRGAESIHFPGSPQAPPLLGTAGREALGAAPFGGLSAGEPDVPHHFATG
jgi:hypothetical protein